MSLNSITKVRDQEGHGDDNANDFSARTPSTNSTDCDQPFCSRSQGPEPSQYCEDDDRKPAAVDKPPTTAVDKPPITVDDNEQPSGALDDKSILQRAYDLIDFTARRFRRSSTATSTFETDVEGGLPNAQTDTRLSPVAARANAKAASAFFTTSASSKQGRRGGSLVPGAEYVQARAPGLSPAFYLRLIRRDLARRAREAHQVGVEAPSVESNQLNARREVSSSSQEANDLETVDATNEGQQHSSNFKPVWSKHRALIILVALILLAAGATTAGICIHRRRKASNEQQLATTPMEPPTLSCDGWFHQKQPSVATQCLCTGKITIVADDVEASYNKLKSNGFIHAIYPGFDSTMDSCDATNQALLWLASATGRPSPQANLRQRYILVLLFLSWNGQKWTVNDGWLSSDDECTWKGVGCESTGEANSIDLYKNDLSGNLGSDYSKLTGLESLSLGQNFLTGTLPSELGLLTALAFLIMETNKLAGSLPNELSLLTVLQEIKLGNNRLSGTIPTWIGQLLELQTLELFNNTLTSTEAEVDKESGGNYSNLWRQHAFPTEIGLLTTLMYLRLGSNELRGTLPTELFKLGTFLQYLDIRDNAISGTIPNLVGNLVIVGKVAFDYNAFTGTIPSEFVQCTNLLDVYLNNNHLHGTVPSSLGMMPLLLELNLTGNDLTGSIPTSICQFTKPILCHTTGNITCSCCVCY